MSARPYRKGDLVSVDSFGFEGAELIIRRYIRDGYYLVDLNEGQFTIHHGLMRRRPAPARGSRRRR